MPNINSEWKDKIGKGIQVKWPVGVEANGNEGVSQKIQEVSGAIGYVELSYAEQKRIPFGSVQNAAGRFVVASVASIGEAAASSAMPPSDFRMSIVNAPGANAYPIASFSWVLVPANLRETPKGKALADFLTWIVGDGQKFAADLFYAPLPGSVALQARKAIEQEK